jgi:CRP/FNR family transcriptional regulator
VKRDDFLRFLKEHGVACMHAAKQVSHECQQAYRQIRSFTMNSAPERMARLMLDWSCDNSGTVTTHGIKVPLTHDEIGQIIGMSRVTVTHTLANFRQQRIAKIHGSTLVIQNMFAIQKLAGA